MAHVGRRPFTGAEIRSPREETARSRGGFSGRHPSELNDGRIVAEIRARRRFRDGQTSSSASSRHQKFGHGTTRPTGAVEHMESLERET